MADAGGTRVDRTIISVEADPQNKRTEKSIENITKEVIDARAEVKRLDGVTRKLSKAMRDGEDVVNDFVKAEVALARAQLKRKDAELAQRKAVEGGNTELEERLDLLVKQDKLTREQAGLAGDIESRTRAITGAVGFVGGAGGEQVERFVNIGAEGLAAVEAVQLLKLELPQMTANLVASAGGAAALTVATVLVAAALAAVAAVYITFKEIVDASKEATEKLIDVNQRYAEIIATSTTKEVEEAIQANKERNKVLELEHERLREFIDATEDIDGLTGAFLDLNDALNTNLGGVEDVQDRLDEVNAELDANADLNAQLGDALTAGATAAADAIAAEEALAAERKSETERIIGDVRKIAETELNISKLTQDQRDKREEELRNSLETELDIRRQISKDIESGFVKDVDAAQLAIEASIEKSRQLENELSIINQTTQTAADLRQQETDAAKLLADQLKLTEQATVDAAKALSANEKLTRATGAKIAKFNEATAEKAEDMALKLLRDQEDFDRERAEDVADFNRDLAELDRDFFEDRADILADTAADLEKIATERQSVIDDANQEARDAERDHRKELRDIQKDANKAIGNAAANLDAQALLAAKEDRKERVEEENERFKEESVIRERERKERLKELERERRERIRDGNQRLQDLRRQHQRERSERIADFNRQLFLEDQNRSLALSRQQEDWNTEDQRRRSHFGLVETETDAHLDKLLISTEDGFAAIQAAWDAGMGGLGDGGAVGAPLLGGSTGPVGAPLVPFIPTPSPLATGGNTFNQIDMPISVGGDAQSAQMARIVRDLVDQRVGELIA